MITKLKDSDKRFTHLLYLSSLLLLNSSKASWSGVRCQTKVINENYVFSVYSQSLTQNFLLCNQRCKFRWMVLQPREETAKMICLQLFANDLQRLSDLTVRIQIVYNFYRLSLSINWFHSSLPQFVCKRVSSLMAKKIFWGQLDK